MPDDSLLSVPEVADLLDVTRQAVWNWRSRHDDFPASQSHEGDPPRFDRSEVLEWHQRRSEPPSPSDPLDAFVTKLVDRRSDLGEFIGNAIVRTSDVHGGGSPGNRVFDLGGPELNLSWDHLLERTKLGFLNVGLDVLGERTQARSGRLARTRGDDGFGASAIRYFVVESIRTMVERGNLAFGERVTIFDPAIGSGYLALGAATAVWDSGITAPQVILGQDIDANIAEVAQAYAGINQRVWLEDQPTSGPTREMEFDIRSGDSLAEESHPGILADIVVCEAPIGGKPQEVDSAIRQQARWRWGSPEHSDPWMWAQVVASRLSENGCGFIVMDNRSLRARSPSGETRAALLRDDLVDQVVALPDLLTSILVIRPNRPRGGSLNQPGPIVMADLAAACDPPDMAYGELLIASEASGALGTNETEDDFDSGLAALREFVDETGTALLVEPEPVSPEPVSPEHAERYDRLYRWCAQARRYYLQGDLEGEQIELLEDLPGWTWSISYLGWERVIRWIEARVTEIGPVELESLAEATVVDLCLHLGPGEQASLERDVIDVEWQAFGSATNRPVRMLRLGSISLLEETGGNNVSPNHNELQAIDVAAWVDGHQTCGAGTQNRSSGHWLGWDQQIRLEALPGWEWAERSKAPGNPMERHQLNRLIRQTIHLAEAETREPEVSCIVVDVNYHLASESGFDLRPGFYTAIRRPFSTPEQINQTFDSVTQTVATTGVSISELTQTLQSQLLQRRRVRWCGLPDLPGLTGWDKVPITMGEQIRPVPGDVVVHGRRPNAFLVTKDTVNTPKPFRASRFEAVFRHDPEALSEGSKQYHLDPEFLACWLNSRVSTFLSRPKPWMSTGGRHHLTDDVPTGLLGFRFPLLDSDEQQSFTVSYRQLTDVLYGAEALTELVDDLRGLLEERLGSTVAQARSVTQSLAARFPEIAQQWHSTKNEGEPRSIPPASRRAFWWVCPIDDTHDWQASPHDRINDGTSCPRCASQ